MHRHALHEEMRGYHDGPPPPLPRGRLMPPPPHSIEEQFAMNHDEIRRLVADNRLLIEENIAMKREIDAAREELHVLGQDIPRIRAEKEAKARELIQMGLKLEADLRALEPIKAEASGLQAEAQRLDALRAEMTTKIQSMSQDLKRMEAENRQLPKLKTEIESLHKEHVRVRTGFEYEQKAHAELLEQRKSMEKNLVSMAREIEKLRAEQMNMEKRARGPGTGAYGAEMGSYPSSFMDGYGREKGPGIYGTGAGTGAGSWSSYDPRGFPRP